MSAPITLKPNKYVDPKVNFYPKPKDLPKMDKSEGEKIDLLVEMHSRGLVSTQTLTQTVLDIHAEEYGSFFLGGRF